MFSYSIIVCSPGKKSLPPDTFSVQGAETYVQGAETYVQGAETYVQGAETENCTGKKGKIYGIERKTVRDRREKSITQI